MTARHCARNTSAPACTICTRRRLSAAAQVEWPARATYSFRCHHAATNLSDSRDSTSRHQQMHQRGPFAFLEQHPCEAACVEVQRKPLGPAQQTPGARAYCWSACSRVHCCCWDAGGRHPLPSSTVQRSGGPPGPYLVPLLERVVCLMRLRQHPHAGASTRCSRSVCGRRISIHRTHRTPWAFSPRRPRKCVPPLEPPLRAAVHNAKDRTTNAGPSVWGHSVQMHVGGLASHVEYRG
jgi:hypothetical protein